MAGRYIPYAHYKPSPVTWQGMLPSHWVSKPLKHLCRFHGGGTPSKDNKGYWSGDIPWVSPKDMKRKFIDSTEDHITIQAVENSSTKLIDERALLIVVRSGILQHSIPVAINTKKVTLNQDMKALIFGKYMVLEFAHYFVEGNQADLLLDWSKQGATVESIEQEYLANAIWPTPPIDEQRSIANFLDHETAKIDTLIDKQQQLIKLLKEKRQAVISHAVTKGLNPDAPMKDSGVEWLGEVPEGWVVTRLKYLATKMKAGPFGSALKQDVYVSKGYRVYGQEQVIPANFSIGDYYIDQNKFDEMSQYKVEPGDLLISCVGTFGKIAIFPKNAEPGIINPRLIKITPDKAVIPEYLEAVLKSSVIYEQLSLLSRGGTMDVINIGILSEIVIPTPSIDEQLKLLDFYNINTLKFDELVNKANSQIDFLQERRTALISAAVTGKIDVRNWKSGG